MLILTGGAAASSGGPPLSGEARELPGTVHCDYAFLLLHLWSHCPHLQSPGTHPPLHKTITYHLVICSSKGAHKPSFPGHTYSQTAFLLMSLPVTVGQSFVGFATSHVLPNGFYQTVSTNFGSCSIFWQKWHISRPIEQGCCFCQFWINSKIGMPK